MDISQIARAMPQESDLAMLITSDRPPSSRITRYFWLLGVLCLALISTRILTRVYAGKSLKLSDCTFESLNLNMDLGPKS